jgi:hypothetical protein
MTMYRDYNGDLWDSEAETMTDWEYLERREHIENVRHWEGDEDTDHMLSQLNKEYGN